MRQVPCDLFFLLMAGLIFMLSNAGCERRFSLANHAKGVLQTVMKTEALIVRMRIASDVPALSPEDTEALVVSVSEAFWSDIAVAPSRAAGAAAANAVRLGKGEQAAAVKRTIKDARIDGSSNKELDDGSAELTARLEFSSEKFKAKASHCQPTEVSDSFHGALMANLMIDTEGSIRTEKWEVGRIKKAKKVNVALPEG